MFKEVDFISKTNKSILYVHENNMHKVLALNQYNLYSYQIDQS